MPKVPATRKYAISPEDAAARRGPPPVDGRLPGQGIPKGAGRLPTEGRPKDQGVPPGTGRLPVEGAVLKGLPGQVDRGSPGQMDPTADNPWAPGAGGDDAWRPAVPAEEPAADADAAFYAQHPNFMAPPTKPDGE